MFQSRNDDIFTLLWMNDAFCELTGYTREEIEQRFGGRFLNMISGKDRELIATLAKRQREKKDCIELEYRIVRGDGSSIWVLDKGRFYSAPDGRETYIRLLIDITVRKRMEEELRLNLERYQAIMDQTTNIIFEWDLKRDTLFLSPNWEKKFGYRAAETGISGSVLHSPRIHPEDNGALAGLMADVRNGKDGTEAELRISNIMGEYIWCRIRATTQFDGEKEPIKAVGVILDIEEEKRRQQELLKAARQDSLTGLLNKAEARRRTEEYLTGEGRDRDGGKLTGMEKGSLLLMDLDDFKRINDRYGHLCGDAVLSDTAAVLRRLFSGNVIGRIGGDEFLVFLPGVEKEEAKERAKKIGTLLGEKRLPDPEDVIGSSVGIAGWPEDAGSFFELYRLADLALYQSKSNGKGGITLYDGECTMRQDPGGLNVLRSGTVIESEDMTDVERQLVSYSFRMLYRSQNIEEAVDQLLEIVGRAYDVSRVYIFESSEDGKYCNNTFEWCNEGIVPQKDALQNISYEEDLNGYQKHFDENGIFYCEDIRRLEKILYDILAPQEIKSMLQCAILDDQEFKGYVGFDECRQNRYWTKEQTKSLGLIANILSEFLIKYRLKERLRRLTACSRQESNGDGK